MKNAIRKSLATVLTSIFLMQGCSNKENVTERGIRSLYSVYESREIEGYEILASEDAWENSEKERRVDIKRNAHTYDYQETDKIGDLWGIEGLDSNNDRYFEKLTIKRTVFTPEMNPKFGHKWYEIIYNSNESNKKTEIRGEKAIIDSIDVYEQTNPENITKYNKLLNEAFNRASQEKYRCWSKLVKRKRTIN